MINKSSHLALKTICLILLVFFLLGGIEESYCQGTGEFVVVREADLRFGPVSIPLNEKTKNELKNYIKSGGDKKNRGPVAFFLYKRKAYEGLLAFLARKGQIKISDIFAERKGLYKVSPRAKKWFQGPVVLSIIDATRKRPLSEKSHGPLAVSDGNLWWIFYRNKNNRIIELQLTIPLKL